ncbi:MAG TPA: ATP-grasp domain-containing protein [Vicinamibacterales bacterium]|nr:ATP-grasp domain-containing protein [Vicinamibacterales bacterium]
MPRILVFSTTTGYQLRAFDRAAERIGCELRFATDRCHQLPDPWRDRAIPVRFYDEPGSLAAVVEALEGRPIDGLLAVGDRPAVLAALAAAQLGVPWHPPEAARAATNKLVTRERLAAAGLPVPWFFSVPATADPREAARRARYPAVVKPLAMAASRGVMRADDEEALVAAFERLRRLLARRDVRAQRHEAHGAILLEGYVPGEELALEGLLEHGTLHPLALFDKPDPLEGPFFEETIYVTPSRRPWREQETIVHTVAAACRALGLFHGPVHAECRVNDAGVFVLEIAPRPIGGLCAGALRFVRRGEGSLSETIAYEELLLRVAAGETPGAFAREGRAAGVMMIPIPARGIFKDVRGVDAARAVPAIEEIVITAKKDQQIAPLPEGASYLGFIFARGESPEAVEQALRAAHARLEFRIERPLPLAIE